MSESIPRSLFRRIRVHELTKAVDGIRVAPSSDGGLRIGLLVMGDERVTHRHLKAICTVYISLVVQMTHGEELYILGRLSAPAEIFRAPWHEFLFTPEVPAEMRNVDFDGHASWSNISALNLPLLHGVQRCTNRFHIANRPATRSVPSKHHDLMRASSDSDAPK